MFRDGAELAFREAFGGDGESAVEASAMILPGDDGGELDKLTLGEVLAQGGVEFVGDSSGCARERGGETKDSLFALVKMRAGFKLRDVVQLLFGDVFFSANGRVDVNSKRAAHHQGDLELG